MSETVPSLLFFTFTTTYPLAVLLSLCYQRFFFCYVINVHVFSLAILQGLVVRCT